MPNLQITTCQVTRIALPAIDLHQCHIPQCTTFVMDVCTFLLQSDSLWDICLMHCGICAMDLWHQDDMPHYPSMKVTMFLGSTLQMVPQHAGTWTQPQHRRPYNVLGGLENRQMFNTMKYRQNGCHFAGGIFKRISMNENGCIFIHFFFVYFTIK